MIASDTKPANFINDDIDSEVRKVVKEIGFQDTSNSIEEHLEGIRNLLQKSQYKESYQNIRPLFENQEGFEALKEIFQFEYNRVLGKTTQENINVANSMEVLKNIFVSNNNQAFEIQKSITGIDQSIKLEKGQFEKLEGGVKKQIKEKSKANLIIKLLRLLFKKTINKAFEKMREEQLGKSQEELNNLKDQFHKTMDSFNKELNSLMDAYGKGIESSTTCITSDPDYATIEEIFPEQRQQDIQQKLPQPDNEPTYVSAKEVRKLKRQQKAAANSKSQETQVNEDRPKPKTASKPSKEVIERALSKAGISTNQKKVAPLVPQRGESSFKKVKELRNKLDAKGNELQPAGSVKDMAKMFEDKAQAKKASVQNAIKQIHVKEEIKSSGLDSTQELAKKLGTIRPNKLNISKEFKEKLEKITTPPPSPSPTSSKKPFAIQNEAPKAQGTKQSVFYCTVSSGVPTPPPMPTEDDLKKVKLTSGKERDTTSQVNPKKHTVTEGKTTEGKNVDLMQSLNENPLFKKRKASIEENDDPRTRLIDPKIEHAKNTPVIGG